MQLMAGIKEGLQHSLEFSMEKLPNQLTGNAPPTNYPTGMKIHLMTLHGRELLVLAGTRTTTFGDRSAVVLAQIFHLTQSGCGRVTTTIIIGFIVDTPL